MTTTTTGCLLTVIDALPHPHLPFDIPDTSATATPYLPLRGQALTARIQAPGSRHGSHLAPSDGMSIIMDSIPAAPLAGISITLI